MSRSQARHTSTVFGGSCATPGHRQTPLVSGFASWLIIPAQNHIGHFRTRDMRPVLADGGCTRRTRATSCFSILAGLL